MTARKGEKMNKSFLSFLCVLVIFAGHLSACEITSVHITNQGVVEMLNNQDETTLSSYLSIQDRAWNFKSQSDMPAQNVIDKEDGYTAVGELSMPMDPAQKIVYTQRVKGDSTSFRYSFEFEFLSDMNLARLNWGFYPPMSIFAGGELVITKISGETVRLSFPYIKDPSFSWNGMVSSIELIAPDGHNYKIVADSPIELLTQQWMLGYEMFFVLKKGLVTAGTKFSHGFTIQGSGVYDLEYSHGEEIFSLDTTGWFEFDLGWDQIPGKGTAVDRTGLLDPPAGKHGFLKAQGDQFVFEDGTPARFWGINLALEACFPTYEQAEIIAKRLAAFGYNLVRLHHMDANFGDSNIFDPTYDDTQHFNLDNLDRLDYFIYCLKEQGIYIYLDQFVSRQFRPGDDIGIDWFEVSDPKQVSVGTPYLYFVPQLLRLQYKYSYDLWTHYNPYTDMRYCDDPAFVLTDIINEAAMGRFECLKDDFRKVEEYNQIVDDRWNEWLKENRSYTTSFDEANDEDFLAFKLFLEEEFLTKAQCYLRKFDVKIPLTGTNLSTMQIFTMHDQVIHNKLCDFIDSHEYWDHPKNWSSISNSPMVKADWTVFDKMSYNAPFDKPYVISEWSTPWPNQYRAESPIWTAAIAAFQGWDGMLLYNYRHSSDEETNYIQKLFETFNDPCYMGLMPIASAVYLRGDVKAANERFAVKIPAAQIMDNSLDVRISAPAYIKTAEVHSLGNYFGGDEIFDLGVRIVGPNEPIVDQSLRVLISDTGEIKRDIDKGIVTIESGRLEVAQGFIGNKVIELPSFNIACQNEFAVIAFSSVVDEDISTASRILLAVIDEAVNTNQVFSSHKRTKILNFGSAPVLVKPIKAEVEIKLDGDFKVWALNEKGERKSEVLLSDKHFTIDGTKQKTIWYEIQRL